MVYSPNNQPITPEYAAEPQLRTLVSGAEEIYKAALGNSTFGDIDVSVRYDVEFPENRQIAEFSGSGSDTRLSVRMTKTDITLALGETELGASSRDNVRRVETIKINLDDYSLRYTSNTYIGRDPGSATAVSEKAPVKVTNDLAIAVQEVQERMGAPRPKSGVAHRIGKILGKAS